MSTRTRRPSNAVTKGTTIGTALGTMIEVLAALAGAPLPVGTGAALTGAIVGIIGWISRGGRQGEAD